MRTDTTARCRSTATGRALALLLAGAIAAGAAGCHGDDEGPAASATAAKETQVLDGGSRILISGPSLSNGVFTRATIRSGVVRADMAAPARVVAASSAPLSGEGRPIVLFDAPELTSLYSTYTQNRTEYDKATRELARTRDLFEHQASTGKDVAEAQTAVATAQATVAETEAKIRALGFNPEELLHAPARTVWLISDVPESQLREVARGERTEIQLASFPGETFSGRVEAIGDVVDDATRTVKVRISLENHGDRFRPGMFARVSFGQSASSVIALPQSAVVTVLGRHYAFVERRPGEFERRSVELGSQIGDSIVVTGGLRDGESVVTGGAMLLKGLSFGY